MSTQQNTEPSKMQIPPPSRTSESKTSESKTSDLPLGLILSFNAGYVDTAGFLALQGLFTAHVTGNFVMLGASIAFGTSGIIAKLLALPVFCAVVVAMRIFSSALQTRALPALEWMFCFKVVLLTVAAAIAIKFGPFRNGDDYLAIATGMSLVTAMAIQNTLHRIYLTSLPPSTLMTGTTTQIMIQLADLLQRAQPNPAKGPEPQVTKLLANVLVFAAGCIIAALVYIQVGMWVFVVPPLFAALSTSLRIYAKASQHS